MIHDPYVSARCGLGFVFALVALSFACPSVIADEVRVTGGSTVVGKIKSLSDGKLIVTTDFAGDVPIDATKVTGVATENHVVVTVKTGEKVVGKLTLGDKGEQFHYRHGALAI